MSKDKSANRTCEFPGTTGRWEGYVRHDFLFDGHPSILVVPASEAPGRPWIWRARFFGAWPAADVALLARGYHLVCTDVAGLFGNPVAVTRWNGFCRYLIDHHGFARKPALEGYSRGGLIIYNWAAANPDRVACIYADAPVCDIRSWPAGFGAGNGNPDSWAECLVAYGITEEQARTFTENPIDRLEPLAEARIPLLHVCGDADQSVPLEENTRVLEQRYRQLGGSITVIVKPGCGHHPHSLEDPTPIVDFIVSHTRGDSTQPGIATKRPLNDIRTRQKHLARVG